MIRSISRGLRGKTLTGLIRLMSSSCRAFPCSGSSDDPMGGQSTEPRLSLSDKNVRGMINGGSEKERSSDRRRGKRWHKFSIPFVEGHKNSLIDVMDACADSDESSICESELALGVVTSRSDKIQIISIQNYAS